MSGFVVVIPARYASERLPGKPLLLLANRPMIRYVYERARESEADRVVIATDDERIADAAREFGATVCMTSAHHGSGTERLAEVCEQNGWADDHCIVNLQGDEPLMPAALINQCAELLDDPDVDLSTLASPLASEADYRNANIVKVIRNDIGDALYFSRAAIPHAREPANAPLAVETALHHHGIYGYRVAVLKRIVAAPPSPVEICERLEQLRALGLGMTIRVGIPAVRPGPGVDTEEDLKRAEQALKLA